MKMTQTRFKLLAMVVTVFIANSGASSAHAFGPKKPDTSETFSISEVAPLFEKATKERYNIGDCIANYYSPAHEGTGLVIGFAYANGIHDSEYLTDVKSSNGGLFTATRTSDIQGAKTLLLRWAGLIKVCANFGDCVLEKIDYVFGLSYLGDIITGVKIRRVYNGVILSDFACGTAPVTPLY